MSEHFIHLMEHELLLITLSLYNNSVVPRNVVQLFVDTIINFVNNKLMNYIKEQLKHRLATNIDQVFSYIQDIEINIARVFDKFKNEYARFTMYKEKGLMIDAEENEIGIDFVKKVVDGNVVDYKNSICAEYIPLSWSLKVLLEIPGSFELLLKHMSELEQEKELISNILQCNLWTKKYKNGKLSENEYLIPLFLYADDFESGNALGSHAGKQKFGAVYASLPGFPPNVSSQLRNIILTLLFKSEHRKTYGNLKLFKPLITELNDLRKKGFIITVNKKKYTVYLQLLLVIGDNLGLSEILGFIDYYNHGRPCRICQASIEEIRAFHSEDMKLLRTIESYDKDIIMNNPSITGIKEKCIFNEVNGFHVCENITLDLMHDIFEGAACYTMINVCDELMIKQKLFSVHYLNDRISIVQACIKNMSNNIPVIKREHIATKRKFKMSAAEMINFTRLFGVLVGDKVDETNEIWKVYLMFRKIIDILCSPRFVEGHLMQLEVLIEDFLSIYIKLFGHATQKLHNMTHLVRTMRQNGPPVHFSTIRFESKHRELKLTAVTSNNRTNVAKTLCIRSLLKLAYLKLTGNFNFGEVIVPDSAPIDAHIRAIYFPTANENNNIIVTKRIEHHGYNYEVDMIIVSEMGDNDALTFGQIYNIFVKNEEVFLLIKKCLVLYFDDHRYVYYVEIQSKFELKNIKEFPDIHPCFLIKTNKNDNRCYVCTQYIL